MLIDSHLLNEVLPVSVLSLRGFDLIAKIVLSLFNGAISVQVFFVISGFVLRRSFDKLPSNFIGAGYEFSLRRVFRLFPAIFFCMLVCFLVGVIGENVCPHCSQFFETAANPANVLKNAILLATEVQKATWTLQVEILVIPLLILIFAIARVAGPAPIIISLACALLSVHQSWFLSSAPSIVYALPYFLCGALMAESVFQKKLQSLSCVSPLVLLLIPFCINLFLPTDGSFIVLIVNVAATAIAVGLLSVFDRPTLFDSCPLQFLGRVSYSLYLLNVPIIWIGMLLLPQIDALTRGLALGVLVMTFSLPLAAYAERFIERPGENIGRRALRRFNITQLLEQTDAALAPRAIRQMRRSAS